MKNELYDIEDKWTLLKYMGKKQLYGYKVTIKGNSGRYAVYGLEKNWYFASITEDDSIDIILESGYINSLKAIEAGIKRVIRG